MAFNRLVDLFPASQKSSYDKNRFEDIDEQQLQEFVCLICLNVFNDPVFSPCCGQIYCSDCIKQWLKSHNNCPNCRKPLSEDKLTQPPKMVSNFWGNLKLKCDHEPSGCTQVLTLDNLPAHVKECRFNPDNICKICDSLMDLGYQHNCILYLKIRIDSLTDEVKRLREEIRQIPVQSVLACHKTTSAKNVNDDCSSNLAADEALAFQLATDLQFDDVNSD